MKKLFAILLVLMLAVSGLAMAEEDTSVENILEKGTFILGLDESMAMTFPYLNNQMIFYTRADAGIDSLEALAGKSVAVQNGSYAEELLSGDYADLAATFSEVLGFDEYLTALMDLQNGGCDAVLMDLVVGDYRINGMGATDLKAAVALTDDNYGIGFRKEDIALRDKVEELLIEMKKDGTLEKISTQWFGSDITVVPAE